jgi:hypothetical protein
VEVEWGEEAAAMVQQLDRGAEIEARGVVRAKRAWLKEDITRRSGALSAEMDARLNDIESEDQLDVVRQRLAMAPSPDQLFA